MPDNILQQQIAYYRARAGEYDQWFYRLGRYDRGHELNQRWFDEVEIVQRALHHLPPVDSILELAAGTGIWTQELAKLGEQVTAIDASAEVIEINRAKLKAASADNPLAAVEYIQADLFEWQPHQHYDLVFFSFWLSHVPPERLDAFLDKVAQAVKPGGLLFAVDSMPDDTSSAHNHEAYQPDSIYHTRKLNDGQEFRIVKVFYEPPALEQKLAQFGFEASVQSSGRYFWYASGFKRR
jgi:2-polyprenyl-3-methyl-5-hydroxy-6-metoxy-1,4-benzoquinol methylase